METKFTNKKITLENIIEIAERMICRFDHYKALAKSEKQKYEEAKAKNESYYQKTVEGKIRYSIEFNNRETINRENDLNWFKTYLYQESENIKNVSITLSGTEEENIPGHYMREYTSVTFFSEKVLLYSDITNMSRNYLVYEIESVINNLPPRFDKLVTNSSRRKILPASNISLPIGIVISSLLFVLCKFNFFTNEITQILSNSFLLSGVLVAIAFFGALIIPTKNTTLYKNIKITSRTVGYDSKYNPIKKNDYDEYKSKCEVAIGEYANMPIIREKIEKNFKRSKKVFLIELCIAVIAIALFFIL